MATYGWIIDRDMLSERYDDDSSAGTIGPGDISDTHEAELEAGNGDNFWLYDDDDELYYVGRIVGDYNGNEPLHDFGTPNAGATKIEIQPRN